MSKLGNIEWKNIYYMICYCVEELEYFDESDIDYEKINGTHDLLAMLLIKSFEKILHNGFIKRYAKNEISTNRPYGILNIEKSYQTSVYSQGNLICDVNNYDLNNELNKIVKAAFNTLINTNSDLDDKINEELLIKLNYYRSLLNEVENINMTKEKVDKININRIERWYKPVIVVAKLILNEYIALDDKENLRLLELNDQTRLCRIWEKFVRRFLRAEYNTDNFEVTRQTYKAGKLKLITDVIVINKVNKKALIIDTKWYEKSDKKSINFYQIDSYCRQLKSRHKNYDVFGCLLYANNNMTCITDSVPPDGDAYWLIDTYDFNINQDFDGIKKDIKNIVDKYIM